MSKVTAEVEVTAEQPSPDGARPLTKFCEAMVDWLISNETDEDAFIHCINICRQKTKPFFLTADEPSTRIGWRKSSYDSTGFFILCFLYKKFEPFRHFPPEEVRRLAAEGGFRYWPNECRLRVIDELRRYYVRKPSIPIPCGLEFEYLPRLHDHNGQEDISADEEDISDEQGDISAPADKRPSYAKVMKARNAPPGRPKFQIDPAKLCSWYERSGSLLAMLSAEERATFETVVYSEASPGAAQVKAVADAKGITKRSARNHLNRLIKCLKELSRKYPDLFRVCEKDIKTIGWRNHIGHRFIKAEEN